MVMRDGTARREGEYWGPEVEVFKGVSAGLR